MNDKYKKYIDKISELCTQMGLVKHIEGEEIGFFIGNDTDFVYGEVIRLFDYTNTFHNKVVFFNKLEKLKYKLNRPYSYIYSNYNKELPFKTKDNVISFNEPLEKVLEKIRYIVTEAIKQRKELDEQIKFERLKEDFK